MPSGDLVVAGDLRVLLVQRSSDDRLGQGHTKSPLPPHLNLVRGIHFKFCPGIYIPKHLLNSNSVEILIHCYRLNLEYKRHPGKKRCGTNG